jgi:hypothetical protein
MPLLKMRKCQYVRLKKSHGGDRGNQHTAPSPQNEALAPQQKTADIIAKQPGVYLQIAKPAATTLPDVGGVHHRRLSGTGVGINRLISGILRFKRSILFWKPPKRSDQRFAYAALPGNFAIRPLRPLRIIEQDMIPSSRHLTITTRPTASRAP